MSRPTAPGGSFNNAPIPTTDTLADYIADVTSPLYPDKSTTETSLASLTAAVPAIAHPGVRAGAYYVPATIEPSAGQSAVSANTAYFLPFLIPGGVVDRMGIDVITGAAGSCRLGLYTNSNGAPGSLIVDAGTVSTSAAAFVETSISPVTLPRAWVWAVAVFDAAPTCRNGQPANPHILGTSITSGLLRGLFASQTFGALPSTAPSITGMSNAAPIIYLRKS